MSEINVGQLVTIDGQKRRLVSVDRERRTARWCTEEEFAGDGWQDARFDESREVPWSKLQ